MQPAFSNFFSVTTNGPKNEVVVMFKHLYPESTGVGDALIMTNCHSDVCSVVLTAEGAQELHRLLENVLNRQD